MHSVRLLALLFCCFVSCNSDSKKPGEYQPATTSNTAVDSVQVQLNSPASQAQLYCSSCHVFPEPSLLDKDTWKNYMLPRMGYMYGIYKTPQEREDLFEANTGGQRVRNSGLFPERQTMPDSIWEDIQEYYLTNAPDSLVVPKPRALQFGQLPFRVKTPDLKVQIPSTTLVEFSNRNTLYIGDANTKSFSEFDNDLNLLRSGTLQEGVVSLRETQNAFWVTSMGSFSPTDQALGSIITISKNQGVAPTQPIKDLQRPVNTSYADLNQDGLEDAVVSEFGKWTGALSLHTQNPSGGYTKTVLHDQPGAITSFIKDMNGDGYLDIIALFAQGSEGVDIYYNSESGNFTRERVLEFSAAMGSSFMDLIDYNNDGFLDVVIAAGDNADYKPLMKPWHGVYVFTNNGKNQFKQELFLHLNGAYNAVINDFDADGDKDVAAISFFPDWENSPQEAFVYFEQTSPNAFTPHTFNQVNQGRWAVMDAADYDSDGDIDLVLGSLAFEVVPKLGFLEQWIQNGIPFIVLENTTK